MSRSTIHSPILSLAVWLAITYFAAGIGAFASRDAAVFYAQLIRPAWAPPGSIFGPVWAVLYTLMGISAWLVWRKKEKASTTAALALFVVQLGANALWSWIFFAWRIGVGAFLEILILLALIGATVMAFWRISRPAGLLMVPYLAWVSFAAALTWSVWRGNPVLQ